MIRILLTDDHALVRQGFRLILSAQPDMQIVGEAGNGREAVELAEKLQPDVVVMDVHVGQADLFEHADPGEVERLRDDDPSHCPPPSRCSMISTSWYLPAW